jgi:tetratricopeptide (TPR) repeat protein
MACSSTSATRVAHGKALPTEVVAQVVAKTDGVLLFVEELTKIVLESGLLQERADRYELTGPLPPLAIPTTLHDSLMARLDRLATGAELQRPYYLALLAEAYEKAGQADERLRVLAEALTAVHTTGERQHEAELYRLKGELLLQQDVLDEQEAESCFRQALDVARQQQAKAFELRAAMSLSRLWQQQGKRAEVHALLAPIYGWFTEGFDTVDLQEAKVLLEAVAC